MQFNCVIWSYTRITLQKYSEDNTLQKRETARGHATATIVDDCMLVPGSPKLKLAYLPVGITVGSSKWSCSAGLP